MICKNCGHKFEGNFCNNCGQNSNVGKITFKQTLESVINGFFQFDRGLLFTVKELILNPGNSIREYIGGKRRKYYNPFSLIIISSLLLLLINYFTKYELGVIAFSNSFIDGIAGAEGPKNTTVLLGKMIKWFSENYAYLILSLLPIISLSTFFAFRKYGYNYLEHLVLNAYIKGVEIILLIVLSVLSIFIKNESLLAYGQVNLGILYSFWVYYRFFNSKKRWLRFFHSILTYIYYSLLIVILVVILLVILILLLD